MSAVSRRSCSAPPIKTGSYESGMQLWKLAPNPVDLLVIDGAGHYEMYDEPEYVDAAVEWLVSFYSNNLQIVVDRDAWPAGARGHGTEATARLRRAPTSRFTSP